MGNRRHDNPGAEPLLNDVQQAQLWQILQQAAPDGGLWNSRKVADWISQLIDRPVPKQLSLGLFAADGITAARSAS